MQSKAKEDKRVKHATLAQRLTIRLQEQGSHLSCLHQQSTRRLSVA